METLEERLENNPSLRDVNPQLTCGKLNKPKVDWSIRDPMNPFVPFDTEEPYDVRELEKTKPCFTNKLFGEGISELPVLKPRKRSSKPQKQKKARIPSILEKRFLELWRAKGGPDLIEEYRFHPTRKWRADFAHGPSKTLIEVEGGAYGNGRHNRMGGFMADSEKYLEAALLGWRVLRLTSPQLKEEILERIIWALEAWSK